MGRGGCSLYAARALFLSGTARRCLKTCSSVALPISGCLSLLRGCVTSQHKGRTPADVVSEVESGARVRRALGHNFEQGKVRVR